MKRIAIIGASSDRQKFGNKAVRAYLKQGYKVFPINPKEEEIEGLKCHKSIMDVPLNIDIVSLYLAPAVCRKIIDDVIQKRPAFVYMNPGTEDDAIEKKLEAAGIGVRKQCSIVAIGMSPSEFK